jgi:hypothetical protein
MQCHFSFAFTNQTTFNSLFFPFFLFYLLELDFVPFLSAGPFVHHGQACQPKLATENGHS